MHEEQVVCYGTRTLNIISDEIGSSSVHSRCSSILEVADHGDSAGEVCLVVAASREKREKRDAILARCASTVHDPPNKALT
jgi:hypothetical protein